MRDWHTLISKLHIRVIRFNFFYILFYFEASALPCSFSLGPHAVGKQRAISVFAYNKSQAMKFKDIVGRKKKEN